MSIIRSGRRVLVTGLDGFTGRYVEAALQAAGHVAVTPAAGFDLASLETVRAGLRDLGFDDVIHLAGVAFVGHADPTDFYRINAVGTAYLLAVLADRATLPGRVIVASSANIYGNTDRSPIDETTPPRPVNHYGASKLAMECLAREAGKVLPVVVTRPFNYTGVGQSSRFVVPKIVDHFRRQEAVIELGNVEIARDFSDVRDVAEDYVDLLDAPAGSVVNICAGRAFALHHVIELCRSITGHDPRITVNPAFVRSDDVVTLCGSDTLLNRLTRLTERRPFEQTLRWMLEDRC